EQPLDRNYVAPDGSKPIEPVYQIWSAFRNVATVFFILIFFLTVFGTAIGWDNYTIKKVLPRLIAGAILVPFSLYICVILVDIGNVVGQGLVALTGQAIPPANINFRSNISVLFLGTGATLGIIAAAGGIVTIGAGVLISILLALLGVFFTLV